MIPGWSFSPNGLNGYGNSYAEHPYQVGYCVRDGSYPFSVMRMRRCPPGANVNSWGECSLPDPCIAGSNCKAPPPPTCSSGGGGGGSGGSGGTAGMSTPNPISIATGTKFLNESDLPLTSSGLEFSRMYRSDSTLGLNDWLTLGNSAMVATKFAAGWLHSHQYALSVGATGTTVYSRRPDGRQIAFAKVGSTWIADPGSDQSLFEVLSQTGERQGWRITDRVSNKIETYSALGDIQKVSFADGKQVSYAFADGGNGLTGLGGFLLNANGTASASVIPAGTLLRISDFAGRAMRLQYDTSLRLVGVQDVSGQFLKYLYGAQGPCTDLACASLASVIYPDSSQKRYLYNETGLAPVSLVSRVLTGIIDERNIRLATYSYDAQGRAIASQRGNGVQAYSLNFVNTSQTIMTDPTGASFTIGYTNSPGGASLGYAKLASRSQPAGSGCAASTRAIGYDASGTPSMVDDFNGIRTCMSNEASRPFEVVRVEGLATTQSCAPVTATAAVLPVGSRKISQQWHPTWRLLTRRAEAGRITSFVYNGQPDPFNSNAIATCAPATAVLPDGSPIAVLCKSVERATTDANGAAGFSAVTQAGVADRVWTYTYNDNGQVLTENGPRTDVVDSTSYVYYATTTADYTFGDLWKTTNALGQTVEFTKYDKYGRVLEAKDPNGVITSSAYDTRGRLVRTTVAGKSTLYGYDLAGQLTRVTRPDGSWIGFSYDTAQRLISVQDNFDNRIEYTLDGAGKRTAEAVKGPVGELRRQVSRVFDALGRVQRVTGRD